MKKIIFILIFTLTLSSSYASKYRWELKYFHDWSTIFRDIDNADSLNIMVAASVQAAFRLVLKSTDAGETWAVSYEDTTLFKSKMINTNEVAYPTKDFCIVTCDSNYYMKTTNGGQTWKEFKIDSVIEFFGLRLISMPDANNGIMATSHRIFISNDGFDSYKQLQLPAWLNIISICMVSPRIIIYIGVEYDGSSTGNERLFKSTDAGSTWMEYPYPNYVFPYRIKFTDSLNGVIAGSDELDGNNGYADLIYKTTDGGEAWWRMLDTTCDYAYGLQDMDMFDNDNGIAVGQFGKIYWTHDGGNTWERDSNALVYKNIPATLRVCMIGKNTALIADFHNRILKSSLVPVSVDEETKITYGDMQISPNPATDFLEISVGASGVRPEQNIEIFSVLGEKVISTPIPNNLTPSPSPKERGVRIDVSSLPQGIYFVKVGDKVGKFVKM